MSAADLAGALGQAMDCVARRDRAGTRLAVVEVLNQRARSGAALPQGAALDLLKKLLGRRWFDIADQLSDPLVQGRDASPEVLRHVARVMTERGRHLPALALLEDLRRTRRSDRAEVLGHIGRIHKQRFLDAQALGESDAGLLSRAIETYLEGYRMRPEVHTWHGVNAVALLCQARALGLAPGQASGSTDGAPEAIARSIRATLLAQDTASLQAWDLATLAEAELALGQVDQAAHWLRRYVEQADAFALGSTLRQFEQVWRLGESSHPAELGLLDLLRASLLEKEDGVVDVGGADLTRGLQARDPGDQAGYQAVFGTDRFDTLENYQRGLARCAAVARIGRTADTGLGTGFLVESASLGLVDAPPLVLLTNAHVLSPDEAEIRQGALHPDEAVITFEAMPDVPREREFGVARVLHTSPRDRLDVTIVALDAEVRLPTPCPIAKVLPTRDSASMVHVIGHPSGRGLSLSTNVLLDHESPRVHYRTATEGGSSGSPVFNRDWKLIALHHAGGEAVPRLNGSPETYAANEGIAIEAIRADLRRP